jgi:hypothetical protein
MPLATRFEVESQQLPLRSITTPALKPVIAELVAGPDGAHRTTVSTVQTRTSPRLVVKSITLIAISAAPRVTSTLEASTG